jgi:hypothetical protein
MDEQEVRRIVKQEMSKNYFSGSPDIPPHQHNGTDNLKINGTNLIPNNKYAGTIIFNAGDAVFNTLVVKGISNPSSVYFYGLAIATIGGISYETSTNGQAQLGRCFKLSASGKNNVVTTNIIQANTYVSFGGSSFFETGTTSNLALARVNGTIYAYIDVVAFTEKSITLQANVDTGWIIEGNIIIT